MKICCDICASPEGKLIHCPTCRVPFHLKCYNAVNEGEPCLACQSVGKTYTLRDRDESGNRIHYTVTERPQECALCAQEKNQNHLMFPLYDDYGKTGRFVTFKSKKKGQLPKPQWAHALCAYHLTLSCSVLYGCNKNGGYDYDNDEVEDDGVDDDDRSGLESVNSELDNSDEGDNKLIHHFVYTTPKPKDRTNLYTQAIQQYRKDGKCEYCGNNSQFRIPLSCKCGTDDQDEEIRPYLRSKKDCLFSAHVGCYRWAKRHGDVPNLRRCFYYPKRGRASVYCDVHARIIMQEGYKDCLDLDIPTEKNQEPAEKAEAPKKETHKKIEKAAAEAKPAKKPKVDKAEKPHAHALPAKKAKTDKAEKPQAQKESDSSKQSKKQARAAMLKTPTCLEAIKELVPAYSGHNLAAQSRALEIAEKNLEKRWGITGDEATSILTTARQEALLEVHRGPLKSFPTRKEKLLVAKMMNQVISTLKAVKGRDAKTAKFKEMKPALKNTYRGSDWHKAWTAVKRLASKTFSDDDDAPEAQAPVPQAPEPLTENTNKSNYSSIKSKDGEYPNDGDDEPDAMGIDEPEAEAKADGMDEEESHFEWDFFIDGETYDPRKAKSFFATWDTVEEGEEI